MLINKSILAVFMALASQQQYVSAFTPPSLPAGRTGSNVAGISSMVATPTTVQATADDTDVSIPYDAAARLAYDAWCEKYNKTPNEDKFDTFKANYETITVANVVAAKEARDNGTDRAKDLELNEYGDFTEAEYMAMQSGGSVEEESEAAPTVAELKAQGEEEEKKGALETVMEASAAQSEASSALSEAADALAEEEEVRFSKLFYVLNFKRYLLMSHMICIHKFYRNLPNNLEWKVSKNLSRQLMQWMVLIPMVERLIPPTFARHVSDRPTSIGVRNMVRHLMNHASPHSHRTFWPWKSMLRRMEGRWY